MIFKPKIPKILQTFSLFTIALVCTITFNTIQTHAFNSDEEYEKSVKAKIDSMGSGSSVGNDSVPRGITSSLTGYLCYLLDENGNAVPGTNAVALKSPGFYEAYGTPIWRATSRKGNYTVDGFSTENTTAPWGCTPWTPINNGDDVESNEPQIRAYFEQKTDNGTDKAVAFVADIWDKGDDKKTFSNKFGKNEIYLVIETMMYFGYADDVKIYKGYAAYTKYQEDIMGMSNAEVVNAAPTSVQNAYYDSLITPKEIRKELLLALDRIYCDDSVVLTYKEKGWFEVGDVVVGTIPGLLNYKHELEREIGSGKNLYVYDSYLNKAAPFTLRITPGDSGEQLGFTAWIGSTSSEISDSDVFTLNGKPAGLAMMVISAKGCKQSTYDEDSPTREIPHAAPKESEGTYTIIKNYRIKLSDTQYEDKGRHITKNVGERILIEDEEDYKVVSWSISPIVDETIKHYPWEPPQPVTQGGLEAPASPVTLQPTDKCLYVLLEKSDDDTQTTADEPQIPNPHPPKKESDGDYTIVKNYRTYNPTTNTYSEGKCFSISNISSSIKIEDEKAYKVIEWRVTDNATTPIDSYPNWSPPGTQSKSGTTLKTITLDPLSDKCLYVLLEKTTATQPPAVTTPTDYNYLLTQSTITKRVRFSTFEAPDSPQNNMNTPLIQNHPFQWTAQAHTTSCLHGHTFTAACKADHVGLHTSSCPSACSSTCTEAHTHSTGCTDPHYYDCGERCQTQIAYCKDWDWLETSLKLSITNTLQSEYPDVLATKQGYNTEPSTGGLVKKYFEVTLQYCTVQKNRTPRRCPVQKFHFSIPINFLTNKSSNYSIPNFLQLIYIYS